MVQMTASKRELHKLVDRLRDEDTEAAKRLLQQLLEDHQGDGEPWSGEGLLSMAGAGEGPSDLAEHHDRYLDPESGE